MDAGLVYTILQSLYQQQGLAGPPRRSEGYTARYIKPECDRRKRPLARRAANHVRYGKAYGENRMRPDGSNRHDRAHRQNPAHAPCWHSAWSPLPAPVAATASPDSAERRPSGPIMRATSEMPGAPLPPSKQPNVSRMSACRPQVCSQVQQEVTVRTPFAFELGWLRIYGD
jgi:hypothetical protein